MAGHRPNLIVAFFSIICLFQCTRGTMECQDLPVGLCAFSVSSSGHRCVLEKNYDSEIRHRAYRCQALEIEGPKNMKGMIESDECVRACGLNRMNVGVSSDALLDSAFTAKLCSASCYSACPNIVHLYFHLAAAEGVYLPKLCRAQRTGSRVLVEEVFLNAKTSLSAGSLGLDISPALSPCV